MKSTIYALIILLGLSSCAKEERLTPSNADQLPQIEQPDLSRPLIKSYKDKYGVGIVYQYNDTSDFRFSFHDKIVANAWTTIKIQKLTSENVDYALAKFEELVLKYFKDEVVFEGQDIKSDLKTRIFPRHLFLADSLGNKYDYIGQYLRELNLYETDKYYSFLWNGYEPMFAFSKTILDKSSDTDIEKYRNSILYCFISHLFLSKGLIQEMPDAFFEEVSSYYGRSINDEAQDDDVPILEGGAGGRYKYYDPKWYASKGFAMTNASPYNTGRYQKETLYAMTLDTAKTMNFPHLERDLRNMLHVLICEDKAENIRNYLMVPAFRDRMRILIRQMYGYGIDVYAINPVAEEYFKE